MAELTNKSLQKANQLILRQELWRNGLNLADPPTDLPDDSLIGGKNIVLTDAGIPEKSKGTLDTSASDVTGAVQGIYDFYDGPTDDTNNTLVAAGGRLYSLNLSTGAWTQLATGLDSTNRYHFATFQDSADNDNHCIVVAAGMAPRKVNKNLVVSLLAGSPPSDSSYVTTWRSRVWLSTGYEITWSDVGDSGAGYSDTISVGESEYPVRAMMGRYDRLYLFKERGLYALQPGPAADLSTAELVLLNGEVGCIAPKTLVLTSYNSFMWVGNDRRVYLMRGDRPEWISRNIQPLLDSLPKDSIENMCAVEFNGYYRLSFPYLGASENNREIFFNLKVAHTEGKEQWSPLREGRNIADYMVLKNSGQDHKLYAGHSVYGRVSDVDYDQYTDNGTNITCEVQSKIFALAEHRPCLCKRVHIRTEGNDALTVKALHENTLQTSVGTVAAGTGSPFGTSITFGAGLTFGDFNSDYGDNTLFFPVSYRHRAVGLSVSATGSQKLRILGIEIEFQPHGGRR